MKYSDYINLIVDSENFVDSLKLDVRRSTKYIEQMSEADKLSDSARDDIVEQNSEYALSIMYITSLLEEIKMMDEKIKLLVDIVYGGVSNETFNRRYEDTVLFEGD